MTTSELVKRMTLKQNALEQKVIKLVVKHILDGLSEALAEGQRIEIRGFAAFSLRYRAARPTHHPKTYLPIRTTPKYHVHFKPGKNLRERVNKKILPPIH